MSDDTTNETEPADFDSILEAMRRETPNPRDTPSRQGTVTYRPTDYGHAVETDGVADKLVQYGEQRAAAAVVAPSASTEKLSTISRPGGDINQVREFSSRPELWSDDNLADAIADAVAASSDERYADTWGSAATIKPVVNRGRIEVSENADGKHITVHVAIDRCRSELGANVIRMNYTPEFVWLMKSEHDMPKLESGEFRELLRYYLRSAAPPTLEPLIERSVFVRRSEEAIEQSRKKSSIRSGSAFELDDSDNAMPPEIAKFTPKIFTAAELVEHADVEVHVDPFPEDRKWIVGATIESARNARNKAIDTVVEYARNILAELECDWPVS